MEYNKNNTSRRPKSEEVSNEYFLSEWERIFGKKSKEDKKMNKNNKENTTN